MIFLLTFFCMLLIGNGDEFFNFEIPFLADDFSISLCNFIWEFIDDGSYDASIYVIFWDRKESRGNSHVYFFLTIFWISLTGEEDDFWEFLRVSLIGDANGFCIFLFIKLVETHFKSYCSMSLFISVRKFVLLSQKFSSFVKE